MISWIAHVRTNRQTLRSYLPICGLSNSSNPNILWMERRPHALVIQDSMFLNLRVDRVGAHVTHQGAAMWRKSWNRRLETICHASAEAGSLTTGLEKGGSIRRRPQLPGARSASV